MRALTWRAHRPCSGHHFILCSLNVIRRRRTKAAALTSLNESLLFDSPADASDFKIFYTSKSWAETEGYEGEFCVTRVSTGEEANKNADPIKSHEKP